MEERLVYNNEEIFSRILTKHFTRSHFREVYEQSGLLQFIYMTMEELLCNNEDMGAFINLYCISVLSESYLNNQHEDRFVEGLGEKDLFKMFQSLKISRQLKNRILRDNLIRRSLQRLLKLGFIEAAPRYRANSKEYFFLLNKDALFVTLGGAQIEINKAIIEYIAQGFLLLMDTGLYIQTVISNAGGWNLLRGKLLPLYEELLEGLGEWNMLKQYDDLENSLLSNHWQKPIITSQGFQYEKQGILLDIAQGSKTNIIESIMLKYPMALKSRGVRLLIIIVPLYVKRNVFENLIRDLNDISKRIHSHPFVILGVGTEQIDEEHISIMSASSEDGNQLSDETAKQLLQGQKEIGEKLDSGFKGVKDGIEDMKNDLEEFEKNVIKEIKKKYSLNTDDGKISLRKALMDISYDNGKKVFELIDNLKNSDRNTRNLYPYRVRDYFYTAEDLYNKIYSEIEDTTADYKTELSFLCTEYIKGMETFLVDWITQLIQIKGISKKHLDYSAKKGKRDLEMYECGPLLHFLDNNKNSFISDKERWGSLKWNSERYCYYEPNCFAVYMMNEWIRDIRNGKMHKTPVYLNASKDNSIDYVRHQTLKCLIDLYEIMV